MSFDFIYFLLNVYLLFFFPSFSICFFSLFIFLFALFLFFSLFIFPQTPLYLHKFSPYHSFLKTSAVSLVSSASFLASLFSFFSLFVYNSSFTMTCFLSFCLSFTFLLPQSQLTHASITVTTDWSAGTPFGELPGKLISARITLSGPRCCSLKAPQTLRKEREEMKEKRTSGWK